MYTQICHGNVRFFPSKLTYLSLSHIIPASSSNGGASPVHGELFATDIDEDTVIKYLDRYIMYYILTADRLERTAVWQRKLPNGKNGGGQIQHLQEVIIEDSLGICDELDKRMNHLVDTYHDEWVSLICFSCSVSILLAAVFPQLRLFRLPPLSDRPKSSRIRLVVPSSSNSSIRTKLSRRTR